ncbi:hypothetical protein LCGC14_0446550 [marine sediment metagenome]|uniref:Uncharacterized protein n=1 Tax=marine sediment metagenome TaxID=412755 RepID=A0A0F9SJ31_9ZZZZ
MKQSLTTITAEERERRRKISESARASDARKAYYDRIRGVKRGPDSLETRAAKSASHRAKYGTPKWDLFYNHALRQYQQEAELQQKLEQ